MWCDCVGDGPASARDEDEDALEKELRVDELSRRRLHGDESDMSESTASCSPEFVSREGPKLGRGRARPDTMCDSPVEGGFGATLCRLAGGDEGVLGVAGEADDEWLRRFRRSAAINASWALLGLSEGTSFRA